MKRIYLVPLGLALVANPAFAIKPFSDGFNDLYVKPGSPLKPKVDEVKCNLCHGKDADGKDSKKVRNEFGKAVARHLKKDDFVGAAKRLDPMSPEGKKAIAEGLEKAAAEKSSSGKSFADLIKAGELPAKE